MATVENEDSYRSLMENIPIGVYRTTPGPKGAILMANSALLQITGFESEEEFKRVSLADYYQDPGERWKFSELLLKKGSVSGMELRLKKKDGTPFWGSVTGRVIRDQNGAVAFFDCTLEDITERKRMEEALRKSEESLIITLNSISDGVIATDQEGRITRMNPAAEHLTGWSLQEAAGLPLAQVFRIFNTQTGEPVPDPFKQVLRTGAAVGLANHTSLLARDGTTRQIADSAAPIRDSKGNTSGVVLVFSDVTEAYATQEALQASEERYRLLVQNANEAILVAQDGVLKFLNPMAVSFYGYSEAELLSTPFIEYIHPDDREMVFERYRKRIAGEVLRDQYRFRIIAGNGSVKWAEIRSVQIEWEGRPAALNLMNDITENKLYEDQLRYLSLHDKLTGLYNRAFFDGEVERLCGSREYPITVISIDLDGLKLINDTMGHERGDALLIKCAAILKQTLRRSDILARIGGDEFVSLLPRSGGEIGEEVGRRIQAHVAQYNSEHPELPMSLSIGIATAENDGEPLVKSIKRSDDLMYRDKIRRRDSSRSLIVDILLSALAERDFINEGHGDRLSALCISIGEKLNLSLRQLIDLSILAQVHDLGKVGIPDSILFKEGPLSEAEWKIMQQHSEKGYYMALSSPDLADLAEFILGHHEWWDGRGYPQGLKGSKIPIECRIIAIADAYDAMTNKRPYRDTLSKEEAIGELEKCAGTQFAPDLVAIMLSILAQDQ